MGHTYTSLMYHGIFSTSRRQQLLAEIDLDPLKRVIGGIIRKRKGKLLAFNAASDHIHLLSFFHPEQAVSDMFRDIKSISCDWVHESYRHLGKFAWQRGYGAFTVSKSNSPAVLEYIAAQARHHRKQTFEEELIHLLKKHEIDYDPRYIFD